jgi:hypothetical protein
MHLTLRLDYLGSGHATRGSVFMPPGVCGPILGVVEREHQQHGLQTWHDASPVLDCVS